MLLLNGVHTTQHGVTRQQQLKNMRQICKRPLKLSHFAANKRRKSLNERSEHMLALISFLRCFDPTPAQFHAYDYRRQECTWLQRQQRQRQQQRTNENSPRL